MYAHTCVTVIKKKRTSNWEEVRGAMAVVGERRDEKAWKEERRGQEQCNYILTKENLKQCLWMPCLLSFVT